MFKYRHPTLFFPFTLFLFFLFIQGSLNAKSFHKQKLIKEISSAVVKIYNVEVKPNYYIPWQMMNQTQSTGSGVIIDNHLILTAAHVVSNSAYLEVKKVSDINKYTAHVKWISHESDLALLEVEDETFFKGTHFRKLGATPKRQESVGVYGYPTGGNEISLTQGIISRIELTNYVHSGESFLTLQIDAAINPGNSGGPVFNRAGEIVGIAMQKLNGVDNIGYVIPPFIIQHFFKDIEDGVYDGYAESGLFIQHMQNKHLKKCIKCLTIILRVF